MNKVMLGLVLGAVLGAIDGLTAWFTPAVRAQIVMIVCFSTLKGLIAGLLIGWFARRVRSVPLGIFFGLVVGFVLAYIIAAMPDPSGNHYWFEIIVPGSLVGLIVGYATQRYGRAPAPRTA
jgi:LytS/YehU family sensor histidine kinase